MRNRKLHLVLLCLFILSAELIFAQNEIATKSNSYKNEKVYTEDLTIDGVKLDKRIAKYYPEKDLFAMKARKVKQLNYLYLHSYSVIDLDKIDVNTKEFIATRFDAGMVENKRKQKEKVLIPVTLDGYKFTIELYSRESIIAEKEKIQ